MNPYNVISKTIFKELCKLYKRVEYSRETDIVYASIDVYKYNKYFQIIFFHDEIDVSSDYLPGDHKINYSNPNMINEINEFIEQNDNRPLIAFRE